MVNFKHVGFFSPKFGEDFCFGSYSKGLKTAVCFLGQRAWRGH